MKANPILLRAEFEVALVLSGGNALGAYQAGAYEALLQHELLPDRVAGASAGAINGGVICGNPPERRLEKLRELWRPANSGPQSWRAWDELRKTHAVMTTLATGQAGLFVPRSLYGPWWNPMGNPEPSSFYDASPMHASFERLIDFDLLNRGEPRYSAAAVDVETGEDVVFDTHVHQIRPEHLRASSALIPAFSPVDIDGRMFGDAGISANLPLDVVLGELPDRPLLCVAIDLLPLRGVRPKSLGDAISRMQDLVFATQSRRAIAAWQAIFMERATRGVAGSVTLLHIAYDDQSREVSGKAFDFSHETAFQRWHAGHRDMDAALRALSAGQATIGGPGLTVYSLHSDSDGNKRLKQVLWGMVPAPA
jgi:NTE family protein